MLISWKLLNLIFFWQLCSLEDTADELKDRCQKLYKGTRKFTYVTVIVFWIIFGIEYLPLYDWRRLLNFLFYREALGIASSGDTAFADSLEAFGGGQDDPVSVSIGGLLRHPIFVFCLLIQFVFELSTLIVYPTVALWLALTHKPCIQINSGRSL